MTSRKIAGIRHAFKLRRARRYAVLTESAHVLRVWAVDEARARAIAVELTGSPAVVVEAL